MNKLAEAMMTKTGTTYNGAPTNETTLNNVLDLFSIAGSSRGKDITSTFHKALGENFELTCRLLMWLRDCRGGAGERQQYKDLMLELIKVPESFKFVPNMIKAIPELGRFDDLLIFMDTKYERTALEVWAHAIKQGNGLAAKWAPRKDSKGARKLRIFMGFNTEKAWRKFIVERTTVVEQAMCAGDWDINFSQVPSLALSRYSTAFMRNNPTGYQVFKNAVAKGEVKINTKALFPYDVLINMRRGDVETANIQWDNLQDFIPEGENIIPVIDTSGSMSTMVTPTMCARDVAISLGLYVSQRLKGDFKDYILTFSSRPELQKLTGTLQNRVRGLRAIHENTNIQAVFELILKKAVQNNIPVEDMPTKVLIVSDMEFDVATRPCWGDDFVSGETALENAERLYAEAGYPMPKIVFWNVRARVNNFPAQKDSKNAVMISGYSPSILSDVLKGDLDPVGAMLKVLNKEKYNL